MSQVLQAFSYGPVGPCAVRANCLSYALEARPEGSWAESPGTGASSHADLPSAGPATMRGSGSRPAGQHDELADRPAART